MITIKFRTLWDLIKFSDKAIRIFDNNNPYKSLNKILKKEIVKCENCDNFYEVIHHIDKNHNNNQISNLKLLCNKCHAKQHTKERKNKSNKHKDPIKELIKLKIIENEQEQLFDEIINSVSKDYLLAKNT